MNAYLEAQIINMITIVKTFEESCRMTATENDGHINKDEAKQLKKINSAAEHFIKELEKIR